MCGSCTGGEADEDTLALTIAVAVATPPDADESAEAAAAAAVAAAAADEPIGVRRTVGFGIGGATLAPAWKEGERAS